MDTPMTANYANLFKYMFETSLLNDFRRNTGKNPFIWLHFINGIFFVSTDGEDSLKELLVFCQKYNETKNMKSVIKFEIWQSTKIIIFLDVCIILNEQTVSTTVFSKFTDADIYLNCKSCHPQHMIRNILKSQFVRFRRICSNTSDYTRKSNAKLKPGYDNFNLKILAKDMAKKVTNP